MEARQILRNALIGALVTIVLYGVAFTWGAIYYQTRLEMWGLPSSLFPLSPQHTYLQAIMPATTLATAPTIWADSTLGYWFFAVLLAILGIPALAARFYTWCGLEAWLAARKPPQPRELSDVDKRMIRWSSWPLMTFVGWLAASVMIGILILVLVGPPCFAALHDGKRAWERKDYLTWPEVTWIDENGQARQGFLCSCAGSWCGIVNTDGAEVVDTGKIKHIAKKRVTGKPPTSLSPSS